MSFLFNDIIVPTDPLTTAVRYVTEDLEPVNRNNPDRWGLAISGEGGMGKTTIADAVMRRSFKIYEQDHPGAAYPESLPVAYVKIPSSATPKRMMQAFADFYGITMTEREPTESIVKRVLAHMADADTRLVVIDELHRLPPGLHRGLAEPKDLLRELLDDVVATFIYAGVDLPEMGIFDGPTGRQIASRFSLLEVNRLPRHATDEEETWRGVIEYIEKKLPLFAQPAGSLVDLDEFLYQQTLGSLGTLMRMICGAAKTLIARGNPDSEVITEDILRRRTRDMQATGMITNIP
ncbi:ATP-binding protein [Salinibacterium sp. ZJ450]|uniref:ATP-binding protein n=1 Tax=Salinibacterium sp. ZJ450 TaxID=2708338 RepID=UPI00141F11A4|nr:ATP-binding protein [Salinibacterium sp. ZJ450]